MTVLAVAALSARMLAEGARADGFETVALDLFGDADTRRACSQWLPIGRPGALHIDAGPLLSALATLARRGDVIGWIAGSGFEGRPDLLERGAALLPLIGTPADAVRRVRDPQLFFDFLDARGIAHPAVRMTAPADAAGWLVKDAHGCGGWHIRRASSHPADTPLPPHHYAQREMPGMAMSATFMANGRDAQVLGFNQLIVRRFGARPFVFCGVVGPVPLPVDMARRITAAVQELTAEFALRGVCSLDFLLDGDAFGVLEVNPRPPASMALYGESTGEAAQPDPSVEAMHGIVGAHVRACLDGELPQWPARASLPVRGTEIVLALAPTRLDDSGAQRLAARARCHDQPAAATRFETGDPICSVSASGSHAGHVLTLLASAREAVHESLETFP